MGVACELSIICYNSLVVNVRNKLNCKTPNSCTELENLLMGGRKNPTQKKFKGTVGKSNLK